MSKNAVFSIASKNYMALARTLFDSVRTVQPEIDLHLLLVDEIDGALDPLSERFKITEVKDIGIPGFKEMAFKYDILEFNTAVKPFFIRHLFEKGYDKVIYFDPDISVYARLDFIFELLDRHPVILTPHITENVPLEDASAFAEENYLVVGTFNLGFIALSRSPETGELLSWWSRRCADACYHEAETGLFVDQKWMNLVPVFIESALVLRHRGCNMAYWNLHERRLNGSAVNGIDPLIFFHFSAIDFDDICRISRHQERFTLEERKDLVSLFEDYRANVLKNGHDDMRRLTYKYDYYQNGEKIGTLARRLYPTARTKFPDPFDTRGESYYSALKRNRLLEHGWEDLLVVREASVKKKRIRVLHALLRLLAMAIGPDRYVVLMKYLNHISSIRRQQFLLKLR